MSKNKKKPSAPAGYSDTTHLEIESISLLKYILSRHRLVVPHLMEQDKRSNTDGELILVQDNIPIGKFEVQVKKLPQKHNYKYVCETSLMSYCETAQNPVLLLGVDLKQKKVYWLYFDSHYLATLDYKDQTSKTIDLKPEQCFDENNTSYFEAWERIVQAHILKIKAYDNVKEERDQIKKQYELLSENVNSAINKRNTIFVKIHRFLDKLNTYLDNDFTIIKKIYYEDCWKLGLTYFIYSPEYLRYFLYPIAIDSNDIQIKEIDEQLVKKMQDEEFESAKWLISPNPIETNPILYAKDIIQKQVEMIIRYRLINHTGSVFLALEYIIYFIDYFYQQMGLELKEHYTISEIEFALYKYLPIWVEEAINFIIKQHRNNRSTPESCFTKGSYIDPSFLDCMIMLEEKEIITKAVKHRLNNSQINIKYWELLDSEKYRFDVFIEFLSYLKSNAINKVTRVYKPRDYDRAERLNNPKWGEFSPEDIEYNLCQFFNNLNDTYNHILQNNFPLLVNQFSLLEGADRAIVTFYVRNLDGDQQNITTNRSMDMFEKAPRYVIYFLKSEVKEQSPAFEVLTREESEGFNEDKGINEITYKGSIYKVLKKQYSVFLPIYDDMPMFNYIYTKLKDNLEAYFQNDTLK